MRPRAGVASDPARLVLLTGPSGAGRSTALKAFEDLGFEAIDNMPISLVPRLVAEPLTRPLALALDSRNRDFSARRLLALVEEIRARDHLRVAFLYLDCQVAGLIRRYSETRRRHPLSPEGPASAGIDLEARLLQPVRPQADILLETDHLTPHELRARIHDLFGLPGAAGMSVHIESFAYRHGLPAGADLVLDCRFLANPYWEPALRGRDGRDGDVQGFVSTDDRFPPFLERVRGLLLSLLPEYASEGKSQLTIAFGCTGGQHRSVVVTEKMTIVLAQAGWRVSKRHRELERIAAHRVPPNSE
ncbi:MAG: RNase adapter RapZ [Roseinatronobacter sp.]